MPFQGSRRTQPCSTLTLEPWTQDCEQRVFNLFKLWLGRLCYRWKPTQTGSEEAARCLQQGTHPSLVPGGCGRVRGLSPLLVVPILCSLDLLRQCLPTPHLSSMGLQLNTSALYPPLLYVFHILTPKESSHLPAGEGVRVT